MAQSQRAVVHIGGRELSGQQVADQISQLVQALASHGVGTGSAVGILALNRPEVLYAIGAGQVMGSRRTALHPMGSRSDHSYVLNDAGIEFLIIDPSEQFVRRAAELLGDVGSLTTVFTLGPATLDGAPFGVDISAQAAECEPQPLAPVELPPDHLVGITYTGGTTGQPKGVMVSAQQIMTMTTIQLAEWEWPERPRFLMCTPLSHAGSAFFAPTVVRGGSLFVLPRFDPTAVFDAIERHKITATMLVPTMVYALLDSPEIDNYDLSSLETIYYGAAAMNPTRLAEAIDRFGPIFAQYYGQSEAPMVITYFSKYDHVDDARDSAAPPRLTSCGRPSPFLQTRLVTDEGTDAQLGEPGEIWVSGPLVTSGYWNKPDETASALDGGWLRTGDVAKADAHGLWYIVDRVKDMIVTGGFNVFPREIEDVIGEHPAVSQVAVIGTPDDKWGETVTAVVVVRDDVEGHGAGDELTGEIQALVKERKGSVHVPKVVHYADSIPVSLLGKPDKKVLRQQFWAGSTRGVN